MREVHSFSTSNDRDTQLMIELKELAKKNRKSLSVYIVKAIRLYEAEIREEMQKLKTIDWKNFDIRPAGRRNG